MNTSSPRDAALVQAMEESGYRLLEPLGSGGMGHVWRALEIALDRIVAIKLIADSASSSTRRERFMVEARALARIQHPNVAVVYRVGDAAELPFLAYEFLDGVSLDRLLGSVSWQEALRVGVDLAHGLAAAHRAGVLHRDIKPANAMLTAAGSAKLIDFGLAKMHDVVASAHESPEAGRSEDPVQVARRMEQAALAVINTLPLHGTAPPALVTVGNGLTGTGSMMGTPRYIAPELWFGKAANPATDVYALGLVLWELLTGQTAHAEDEPTAMVNAIIQQPLPEVAELCSGIPSGFAAIVDRAVRKEAHDRFASADELVEELDAEAANLGLPRGSMRPAAPTARVARLPTRDDGSSIPGQVARDRWPVTRYAKSGSVNIAYQTFGHGAMHLVYIPAWISHCEFAWLLPECERFLQALGRIARVTVLDKRGTGMSDRMPLEMPVEERMQDIPAVLDAIGVDAAVLLGVQDGGAMASVYAAMHPERVHGVIWYGAGRRLTAAADYPYGMPPELFAQVCGAIEHDWGAPLFADFAAPSGANDPAFLHWWADYLRHGASPGAALSTLRLNASMDSGVALPALGVSALVIHRAGDRMMPAAGSRMVADWIPHSRHVELPGDDHLPWMGDADAVVQAVATFMREWPAMPRSDRRLVTVLAVTARSAATVAEMAAETERTGGIVLLRPDTAGQTEAPPCALVTGLAGPVAAVRQAAAWLRRELATTAVVHIGASDGDETWASPLAIEARAALSRQPGALLVSSKALALCGGAGLEVAHEPLGEIAAGVTLLRVREPA